MISPFVTFVAHPSGAPFASFSPWATTAGDVGVWRAFSEGLERSGVNSPPFQSEEAQLLYPKALKNLCLTLSGIQNLTPEKYALALTHAATAVPGAKIFRPRTIPLGEAKIQMDHGKNPKPWRERLFDDEEARHFNFYPMYHDLKRIFLEVITLAIEQFMEPQTVSVPLNMALDKDADGNYHFNLQDSDNEGLNRGLCIRLEVETNGTAEPAKVRIGCRLKLLKKDEKTALHQELYGLMNHLLWIFDNFNEEQARRKRGWLKTGDMISLAGIPILLKNGRPS